MRAFRELTSRGLGVCPDASVRGDGVTGAAKRPDRVAASIAARSVTCDRKAAAPGVSRGWRVHSAVAWSLACLVLSATLAPAATAVPTPPSPAAYAVRVLSTLQCLSSFACPNATFDLSNAAGINDRGWIVGDANVPGSTNIGNATEHATVWRNGAITDLGTLGGPNSSIGFVAKPNDTGLLSGNAQINTVDPFGEGWGLNFGCDPIGDPCAGSQYETRGFVWRGGVIRALPTLGGNNALAFGGANDQGEIVGTAEIGVQDPTCTAPQVFDWKPVVWGSGHGRIRELPQYPGDTIGAASAINDNGQIVGGSGTCGPPTFSAIAHALLWQGNSMINLGSLGGQYNNLPTAINDNGQIVGWSDLPGDATTHAFLWQNGAMTDLGTLPSDASSFAYAINDHAQVVGQSCDRSGNCRGFLWQHGVMTDLNAITGKPASFDVLTAEGINDQGVIVGNVFDPAVGTFFAYAATPSGNTANANQSSTGSGQLTPGATAPNVILPARARAQLRTQLRAGLLLGRAR
jgi:probable HAF family extracellular repeat protein